VGVRGQARLIVEFVTKVVDLFRRQAPLQKGTRVDARRDMSLEVHQVTCMLVCSAAKEVVEANFIECGGRGVRGDMPANALLLPVGPYNHGHGIPADDTLKTFLKFPVTRISRLLIAGNRIHIGGIGRKGQAKPTMMGMQGKFAQQLLHTVRACSMQDFIH